MGILYLDFEIQKFGCNLDVCLMIVFIILSYLLLLLLLRLRTSQKRKAVLVRIMIGLGSVFGGSGTGDWAGDWLVVEFRK